MSDLGLESVSMRDPVASPGDNAFMHHKPQANIDTTQPTERPLETMISELEAVDPAAAPDIADEIAARLEADLASASADSAPPPEPIVERLPFAEEVVDNL